MDEDLESRLSASIEKKDPAKIGKDRKKKRCLVRKHEDSDSGEDTGMSDFESEMNEELERRVATHLKNEHLEHLTSFMKQGKKESPSSGKYEKYFDTDSEEETGNSDDGKAEANNELFYDPLMDGKDEVYVQKQRGKYNKKLVKGPSGKSSVPNSDAVLNCPACFTTLCHDCQRHEIYRTQYRAMFTFNCKVDENETMKMKPRNMGSKKSASRNHVNNIKTDDQEEVYHPVRCVTCNTHVAMFDSDEVYHFFNVITSH